MAKRTIAVFVLIETDNPRLFPENIDVSTVPAAARLRMDVLKEMPDSVTRVMFVCHETMARAMCDATDQVAKKFGFPPERPPQDYIPPTRG